MTVMTFLWAVLALLLAPGPTNTLMGIAGAQRGLAGMLRLLPAELAGYMTTILPLAWAGAALLERHPIMAVAMKLAAAAWVMVLAVKLWQRPSDRAGTGHIGARRIYVTTVLNPKALIFGLVLLPQAGAAEFPSRLALFCLAVMAAAATWGAAGALTQAGQGGAGRLQGVQRAASVWLAFVSISLAMAVLRT